MELDKSILARAKKDRMSNPMNGHPEMDQQNLRKNNYNQYPILI